MTKSQGLCTEQLFCVIFAIKKRSEKEIGKYKKSRVDLNAGLVIYYEMVISGEVCPNDRKL